ncbi:MAG: hypothetical protein ACRYFK_04225 [Janthinobacterium lividum]
MSRNSLGPGTSLTDALADVPGPRRASNLIPDGLGGAYQAAHDSAIVN